MTAASRIVSFFLLGLLGFLSVPATAQAWRWAQRPTGARGQSAAVATVITATGESYFAYVHQDSLTLGTQTFPGPVVSPGQYITNTVIARYDAAGAVVGFALVGTAAAVEDLELDAAGNLYATGHFSGQLTSGTSALTALGTYDLFVAKWNAAGTIQWLKQGRRQLDNIQQHSQVAIDGAGNVTIAAGFRDSVTFDGHTVTADSGQNTLVVAQYDASGAFRWAKATTGHAPSVVISDLAAAPNGTLHLVGTCYSGFVWDTKPVPPFTGAISYWLKLDVNGQMLDAERFGNLYSYYPQVATDATGAAYIACSSNVLYSTWGDVPLPVPANAESHFSVIRLTPAGTPQWVRTAWVPLGPQGSANIVENTSLRVVSDLPGDGGGDVRVYLGGRFITPDSAVMTCGPFTLHTDRRRLFDGYLLALDGLSGRPAWLLPVGSGPRNEFVSSLGANAAGELTVSGFFMGDTSYFGNTYLLNGPATYIAKLAQRYNLLQGTTFQDPNTNGRRDAGESALESVVVAAEPGPTYFTTSSTGQYSAVADLGTYTLSIPNPPRYHTAVASGSATASFSSYGNVSTGHDFAIQGIPGQQDLQVFVTPMSRARPGFAVSYRLTARNVGTVPVAAGNLRLTIPETLLAYVSSTPAGTHAGSTTSWAMPTILPGETHHFDALFQLAVTAPLGRVLTATAVLEPLTGDLTPADNTAIHELTVTGSYDPNDITVNYPILTLPQVQNAEKPLDYTVRFQNMGTDTAFTVVLRDTLPAAMLNLGTVQLLAASHTCTWRLGAGGVITVSFANIRLPHRTANTLRSMGFVRFRVVPRTSLALGDLIPNQAAIYFDYNAPIRTNTALTTVGNPTGVAPDAAGLTGGAWPNPTVTELHVAVTRPAGTALTLTLTDAVGRVVRTQPLATGDEQARATLDVRGLAPGLYLVRAAAGTRAWSQRVVVR